MKRIIYSCFLLTFFLLSKNIVAQPFQATVTPQIQCFDPAGNFALAAVTAAAAGANTYTWTLVSPGCAGTFTYSPAAINGSIAAFTFPCCGTYTIHCKAFAGAIQIDEVLIYPTVVCPITPTIVTSAAASNNTTCAGSSVTLTANGAVTWTWNPGGTPGGNTLVVTPTTTTDYSVTGTTAQGCTVQGVFTTSVQTIDVFISPPSQTICAGKTLTLNANAVATGPSNNISYQWYSLAPLVPLGTASAQAVNPAATTVYSVLATVSTCSASATNTVTIGPNLSVLPVSSSQSVCPSENFTLTAFSSATSFTWVPPTGVTGSLTGNPVTFTTGPGTYSVYGVDGSCTGSNTIVMFQSSFTPSISVSSASVCPGESFTLTGTGGVTGTYTWVSVVPPSPPNLPSLIVAAAPGTLQTSQAASTIYGFSVTSPVGCTGSTFTLVPIAPAYTVTASASGSSVCAGGSVTLTTSGASSYTWVSSTTGTFVPSTTSSTVTDNPLSNTTYSVYGSSSSGYCTSVPATVTVVMTVGGSLPLNVSVSNPTICTGQTSTLTASATGATSYTWSPGATLNTTLGGIVVSAPTSTGLTSYTVIASNSDGGCSSTGTAAVYVTPTPTVTAIASANAVCVGFTSTITASGASSYTWTGSTFSNPIYQPSISVSPGAPNVQGPQPPGTYTVYGSAAGANCISAMLIVTITVAPSLSITTTQTEYTTCIINNQPKYSKPVVLTASGAQTYVWFPYNPIYMTYSVGPSTTVRPPTSTCYTVTGATSVCSGSAVVCVTVIPQFTMEVVPPLPAMCLGDSIKLSVININTLAVGPPSAYTYSWTEAANAPPPSITDIFTPTVMAFPQNTTTYTVEVKDSRGCAGIPRLVTVTVLPQPITAIALPIINNVPTNTVCFVGDFPSAPDNIITLTANNANTSPALPFGVVPTYTWTSPYNPSSIVTNANTSNVTVKAPTRLPTVAVYTLITGYNGIPGCIRFDTVSIRIIDCRPVVSGSVAFITDVEKDTLCARTCITFIPLTDTVAGGPQTYLWKFTGGNPAISTEKRPTICYNLKGQYDVVLSVTNPYPLYEVPPGSTGTRAIHQYIDVVDIPNVTIVPPGQRVSDTTMKYGQSVVLTATNAARYVWAPHSNISALTGSIVTVNPIKTTLYYVTGYNSKNCFSMDSVNVIVIDDCGEMYVPNAFSPNGDGVNDVLYVRGICLETLTFMVFDRWGEKVFEATDINSGWDGTFHGEKMNTGVFVYRLEGKTHHGQGFSSKGNITLIR